MSSTITAPGTSSYAITDTARIQRIQKMMAPMKLLIADGHHRYETSLNYRNLHPDDLAARIRDDDVRQYVFAGPADSGEHRVLNKLWTPCGHRRIL